MAEERACLLRLMQLFFELPPPPDPHGLYPAYAELKARVLEVARGDDFDALEEAFVHLYAHVHGYDVPYTPEERTRLAETRGYLNHVGGLTPILKAPGFLSPQAVSGDFGAGNGLQGLLMQLLSPHRRTVQVEISGRLVESGRLLQGWLGIPAERVEWVVGDVDDVSPVGMDLVYLYRPVRPGGGFYRRFAAKLASDTRPVVIFSIADCLGPRLPQDFEVLSSDGHFTCFRRGSPSSG